MSQPATHDVIVVGGGPAALGAALYTGRAELKTVVLERRALGGQVAETDAVENYPGFPEGVSGPKLTDLMAAQAKRFGADIRMEEVSKDRAGRRHESRHDRRRRISRAGGRSWRWARTR